MYIAGSANNMQNLASSNDNVGLLALRLVCITAMMALLMMHLRSVRVFRWEQAVSGGVIVTYSIAVVGLALCAGIEDCGGKVLQHGLRSAHGFRLLALGTAVVMMNVHFRTLRMLRPLLYQSIPGFVLVMNVGLFISLTICVGLGKCGFFEVWVYLTGAGSVLLALNAATIWRRWRRAGDLTRVVAELLGALGVPLRRQVLTKAFLSAAAALLLLIDLAWNLFQFQQKKKSQ